MQRGFTVISSIARRRHTCVECLEGNTVLIEIHLWLLIVKYCRGVGEQERMHGVTGIYRITFPHWSSFGLLQISAVQAKLLLKMDLRVCWKFESLRAFSNKMRINHFLGVQTFLSDSVSFYKCKPVMMCLLWICTVFLAHLVTGQRSCVSVCQCSDSAETVTVHCANKGLSSLPENIPHNVTNLDLSKNPLHVLNTFTFETSHLSNVLRLDLRLCEISQIDENILEKLVSLEELNLDQNRLQQLTANTFSFLRHLKILSLNNNQLRTIGNYTFQGLNLDHLNLNDNVQLSEIESAAFFNSSIQYLSIDRCSLPTISVQTLRFLQQNMKVFFWSNSHSVAVPEQLFSGFRLETLHMTDDGITNVDFLRNTNVVDLDLSGTPLGTINLNFQGAEGLRTTEHLSFSRCHLTEFQIGESTLLPKLRQLDLSHNRLSAIHPRTFLRSRQISTLDLSHNLLYSLPEKLFRPLNRLEHVDLSTNPLICDCKLEWLRQRIVETNGRTLITGAMCHSPVQISLEESLPFICPANISGFHLLPEVQGAQAGIKMCCSAHGSPQVAVATCGSNATRTHHATPSSETKASFQNREFPLKGHTDVVGTNTCEVYVQVDLVQCCVIECKANNTEGETLSVFNTCEVNSTHIAGGTYSINHDTSSDPSEDTQTPQNQPWYSQVPVLTCIGVGSSVFILILLAVFAVWYRDRYKKLRRWHQLSPSINRRGRDNYPAAVGLIPAGGSADFDCDIDLDDETEIHVSLWTFLSYKYKGDRKQLSTSVHFRPSEGMHDKFVWNLLLKLQVFFACCGMIVCRTFPWITAMVSQDKWSYFLAVGNQYSKNVQIHECLSCRRAFTCILFFFLQENKKRIIMQCVHGTLPWNVFAF